MSKTKCRSKADGGNSAMSDPVDGIIPDLGLADLDEDDGASSNASLTATKAVKVINAVTNVS